MRLFTVILLIIPFCLISAQIESEANKKIMLAKNFEQAGQYENAIKLYDELHANDPLNSNFYSELNRLYIKQKIMLLP